MKVGGDEELSSCPSNGDQVVVRTMEYILDTTPETVIIYSRAYKQMCPVSVSQLNYYLHDQGS